MFTEHNLTYPFQKTTGVFNLVFQVKAFKSLAQPFITALIHCCDLLLLSFACLSLTNCIKSWRVTEYIVGSENMNFGVMQNIIYPPDSSFAHSFICPFHKYLISTGDEGLYNFDGQVVRMEKSL
jgi:hypothetical protein